MNELPFLSNIIRILYIYKISSTHHPHHSYQSTINPINLLLSFFTSLYCSDFTLKTIRISILYKNANLRRPKKFLTWRSRLPAQWARMKQRLYVHQFWLHLDKRRTPKIRQKMGSHQLHRQSLPWYMHTRPRRGVASV